MLRGGHPDVEWIETDASAADASASLGAVRDRIVDAGRRITGAAAAGDAPGALDALGAMRVLCAHRRGPYGVTGWTARIERWLAESIDGYATDGIWYVGRPLLVTANDYALRLYNGDTGVIVRSPDHGVVAAFQRGSTTVEISPRRISAVDTVHAMTIHKSQGSQFAAVAVVLPEPTSPILTRELLYTAVTRAQRHLIVVGTEASIRASVARPIARATGFGTGCGAIPTGEGVIARGTVASDRVAVLVGAQEHERPRRCRLGWSGQGSPRARRRRSSEGRRGRAVARRN